MNPSNNIGKNEKVLIVGKGIAGTMLAFRLLQSGIPFWVVDRDNGQKSSAVASGLINPVVVKTFGSTWRANDLISETQLFYPFIEEVTNSRFFYPSPIFRMFYKDDQEKLWNRMREKNDAEQFMKSAPGYHRLFPEDLPVEGGEIRQSARVDVPVFMEATSRFFRDKGLLVQKTFTMEDIFPVSIGWSYLGEQFTRVVFCQGTEIQQSFFKDLPVNPLKGQLLNVRIPGMNQDFTISRKVFILPLEKDLFKVGATYERTTNPGTTAEGKQYLTGKLKEIISNRDFEILDHYYGFRPTIPDRKPVMGEHPGLKGIYIFNGLGSKGYMMAPWLSKQLVSFMIDWEALPVEVDVSRFLM